MNLIVIAIAITAIAVVPANAAKSIVGKWGGDGEQCAFDPR